MSAVITIMRKEWLDLVRDRRTVFIAIVMGALLAPALVIGINIFAAEKQSERYEALLEVPVVNAEAAPNLVVWLNQRNVKVVPAPDNIEAAIRSQDVELVVVIREDFADQWYAQERAMVDVFFDSSRESARVARSRVAGLLSDYSGTVGRVRMLARGIDPGSASALQVVAQDLATQKSRAGQALAFLPYFLILTAFLGGAYFVVDTTAGERERESLESLLLVPVPASHIMLGKVAAAVLFAITMITVALVAFKISFEFAPNLLKEMTLGWGSVFLILVVLAPVAVLGVALLTLLSANAKSVKEAQSYMSMLMLLPVLPTLVLMINPVKTETWMYAVPFLSQNQLVMAVLRGEGLSSLEVAVYLVSQITLACVILFAAAKLYASERMALGR